MKLKQLLINREWCKGCGTVSNSAPSPCWNWMERTMNGGIIWVIFITFGLSCNNQMINKKEDKLNNR